MQNKNEGTLFGILSGLFWGLGTVVLGIALAQLVDQSYQGSLSTTFIHDSFSFIILLIVLISTGRIVKFVKVVFSKSGLAIMSAALLGGPIGMGAYIIAIENLSPSLAASISAIYPAFGALLAYLILKEKISKRQLIGLLISVFAIMLMGFGPKLDVKNWLAGLLAISLCVVGWGSEAVIISWALKDEVDSTVALAIRQMTSSFVYLLIIIPLIGYDIPVLIFSSKNILVIIGIAAFLGTFSYMFYYKAIDLLGATRAMALNITYPFWAFVAQSLLFKSFELKQALLVLIILFGAYYGISDANKSHDLK
ncbi:MAG TPA: DMT family transporter [Erysipelothrix sp.]